MHRCLTATELRYAGSAVIGLKHAGGVCLSLLEPLPLSLLQKTKQNTAQLKFALALHSWTSCPPLFSLKVFANDLRAVLSGIIQASVQ